MQMITKNLLLSVLGSGFLVLGAGSGFMVPVAGAWFALRTPNQAPEPRAQNPEPRTGVSAAGSPARDLVTTYCISCHHPKLKAGSFGLDPADAERISSS